MSEQSEIIDLIDELVSTEVNLDSEYYRELEEVTLSRARALSLKLKFTGFDDIADEIERIGFDEGNLIPILELIRGFVKEETHRRIERSSDNENDGFEFWDMIHPRIRKVARSRFESGHYADSVESSLKEVNTVVKQLVKNETGQEFDGAALMNKAFSAQQPIIRLSAMNTKSDSDLQRGYMQIFAGSMTGIRNPKAHDNLIIVRSRAVHLLFLSSLLMAKVDERESDDI